MSNLNGVDPTNGKPLPTKEQVVQALELLARAKKKQSEHEPHYNNICKSEFERGYNFGKKDAYEELFTEGGKYKVELQSDEVVIVIPREKFIHLKNEAERTA